MAFDPGAAYDIKKRGLRDLANVVPGVAGASVGAIAGSNPQLGIRAAPLAGFVNDVANPAGRGLDAAAHAIATTPQPDQTTAGPPVAPVNPAAASPLPNDVHQSNVAGIFEGKRGLAGERVFSDNQFDPLLTDRSGGLRAATPAMTQALASTPGAISPNGLREDFNPSLAPTSTPQYRFATPNAPTGLREAQARMSPQGAAALDEAPADIAKRIGSNDPAAIGAEIAANKMALANTRYARGASGETFGGPGAAGAPGVGGFPGPVSLKDIADFQKTGADIRHTGFQDDLEANKVANERGQKTYDEVYARSKDLAPGQRGNLSAEDYANLIASTHSEATPDIHANADRATNTLLANLFNSTKIPLVGREPLSPQDFNKLDVEPFNVGNHGAGLRYATTPGGKSLSIEDAHAREKSGQPVNWVTTNQDKAGPFANLLNPGSSDAANLIASPEIGAALQARLNARRRQRAPKQQGLPRE